jgi:hypothetical protein
MTCFITCSGYLIQSATSAGKQPAGPVLFFSQMSQVVAIHSSAMADIRKDIMRVCLCVKHRFICSFHTLCSFNSDEFHSPRH